MIIYEIGASKSEINNHEKDKHLTVTYQLMLQNQIRIYFICRS